MIIKIKIKIKKIDHIGVKGDVPIIWNIWGTFGTFGEHLEHLKGTFGTFKRNIWNI